MANMMFTNMSTSSPCSRGRTGGASRRPCFIMASPRPRPNPPSNRCAASPSGERSTASPDESHETKRRDGEYYPSKVLWPGIEKTDAYLRKMDFRAKKSLGQNFMIQENVLSKTVAYAGVQKGDRVLEIGSGTGNLTRYMLAKGAEVVCVEKDDRLHEAFVKEFEEEVKSKRLKVVHADVMRWLTERDRRERELVASGGSVDQMLRFDKVVANLPFNITTDLLKFLLPRCESVFRPPTGSPESRPSGDVFLLLQDEAARRLCECRAGDSNYRAMNVLVDCFCSSTEYLFKIDRKAFFPAPNVDGALAHFKIRPREEALSVGQV